MTTERVLVVQEQLPKYRLAFFEELGTRVSLTVATEEHDQWPSVQNFAIAPLRLTRRWSGTPFQTVHALDVVGLVRRLDPASVVMSANPRFIFNREISAEAVRLGARRLGWGLGTMDITPLVPSSVRSFGRRRMIRYFDEVLAYSTRGAAEFARLGLSPDRVHVALNSKWSRDALPSREPHRWNGKLNVAYLGRVTERKKVDVLIRAFHGISSDVRGNLIVIGMGPELESLRQLASELHCNVRFAGHLDGQALSEELSNVDLVVLPGTGGLAMHDAFAYGLPVICGRGDGTQYDLVTDECGWIMEDLGVVSLRERLESIARTPEQLPAMQRAARARVAETFNVQQMADVFESVLSRQTANPEGP